MRPLSDELSKLSELNHRSVFFDLVESREDTIDFSKFNENECQLTFLLLQGITAQVGGKFQNLKKKIGIITPYKAHVQQLKNKISPWLRNQGCSAFDIFIDTVDSFQGRELDIVIFNCVRSNPIRGYSQIRAAMGFLGDVRRLNVAITRPRHFLYVVGNRETLKMHEVWRRFMDHHRVVTLSEKIERYSYENLLAALAGTTVLASDHFKPLDLQIQQKPKKKQLLYEDV